MKKTQLASALLCLSALVQYPSHADEVEHFSAKALFYGPNGEIVTVPTASDKPTPSPTDSTTNPTAHDPAIRPRSQQGHRLASLGLRASVLRVAANGGTQEVAPSHHFKSGERLRLSFESNRAGYFYLVGHGSSGEYHVLAPRSGEAVMLEPGYHYTFPGKADAYFKLDQRVGKEEIWALLSEVPLDSAVLGDKASVVLRERQEGVTPTAAANAAPAAMANADELEVAKDLVFEEDAASVYVTTRPHPSRAEKTGGPATVKPMVMFRLVINHD